MTGRQGMHLKGCELCNSKTVVKLYGPIRVCQKHEDRIAAVVAASKARTVTARQSVGRPHS
jgi:hypothetical protein